MAHDNVQNLYTTAWRLMRRLAFGNLKKFCLKLHPSDLADVIARFAVPEQDQIIELIDNPPHLPEVFASLGGRFFYEYYLRHPKKEAFCAKILQNLASDDQADLLAHFKDEDAKKILGYLKDDESHTVHELMQYKETTAGGLMSTEVLKLSEDLNVNQALNHLQKARDEVTIYYIYVINSLENLTGVLSLRQLFQAAPDTKLKEIMLRDVVRVNVNETQKEVAHLVAQYDLVAVPVVDEENKLAGVITVDDVIDVIQEEAAENALKMSSPEVADIQEFRFSKSIKKRLPWFLLLLIGGLFTAEVIQFFYTKLPIWVVIIGFIPLMLRFGGVMARQSSTVMIQSWVADKTSFSLWRIFYQQLSINLTITFISVWLVGLYAWLRFSSLTINIIEFALALSLALLLSMLFAFLLGLFLPVFLKRIKVDPAWSTGTFINTILDVVGLVIYFKVALWFL